ncbi:TPA: hypothetical protein ACN36H_003140 [Vibrio parahaemolyticus]
MTTRSHLDTLLFVRFMDISADSIPKDMQQVLRDFSSDRLLLDEAFSMQFDVSRPVMLHENYHYWQALRLPYVHRFASTSFITIFLKFRQFATSTQDYTEWTGDLDELDALTRKSGIWGRPLDAHASMFGCSLTPKHSSGVKDQSGRAPTIVLSPLEMLENGASVAEFQFSNPGLDGFNPTRYKKWCIRNPAYTKIYDYVRSCLPSEILAYRIFLPLINVSFETSDPVRAFASLLFEIWKVVQDDEDLLKKMENGDPYLYRTLLTNILENLEYEDEVDSQMGSHALQPFQRLTIESCVGGSFGIMEEGDVNHPYLTINAKTWVDAIESGCREFLALLDHPASLTKGEVDLCAQTFSPPLTCVKFTLPEGSTRVVMWGNINQVSELYRSSFMNPGDILTMYSLIRRATKFNFDPSFRLCGHQACPYYEDNFCNAFIGVPENFEACTFPSSVSNLIRIISDD